MKKGKFLFVAVFLTCIVGVTQTNAQAEVNRGPELKAVYYEVDGVQYEALADVDWQSIVTPSDNFKWVSKGDIVQAEEVLTGIVHLDPIPLPKKTVIYYDNSTNGEKITITPSGQVTVVVLERDADWLKD